MYGAILGDMIGAPYEFDRGAKTKDFPLLSQGSRFTDDTVMTIAVADALLEVGEEADEAAVCAAVVRAMQRWGRMYPRVGYGGLFRRWLASDEPEPYGSFGNGSAMRVAAAGWLYDTLARTREAARQTAATFRFQRFGHAVESFGDAARDAGDRVRITADGHGISHGILEIRAF